LAESIAKATYKDGNGIDQPSPNKWQALYILGQIYDARRKPAQAVSYYQQVAERFSDASDAVRSFTRKDLKLPEVSVVRPSNRPKVAARGGVPIVNASLREPLPADEPKPEYPDRVELNYRNIPEVDVKVYPVDLMRLYLTRRNLDGIAGIDLAGITPLYETTVKLGEGADYQDKLKSLDLPLEKEGAYLVMIRGENLYASGIVLVSPLKLEVNEEPGAGRVRVTVRDAKTGDLIPKVQVKVIGSDTPTFLSGESDLRGVYVAEGVRGQVTAVARKGTAQYAFHRGTAYVGAPPEPAKPANAPVASPVDGQSLEQNLRMLNDSNRARQIDRLNERYKAAPSGKGVQVQKAY
jgi:alpha-2-macroglobulin